MSISEENKLNFVGNVKSILHVGYIYNAGLQGQDNGP